MAVSGNNARKICMRRASSTSGSAPHRIPAVAIRATLRKPPMANRTKTPVGRKLPNTLQSGVELARRQLSIRGPLRGVGCRPFVHNLARRLGLAGSVLNSSAGVVAEVEGAPDAFDSFVESLRSEAPPLARIEEMLVAEIDPLGERDFAIRESRAREGEFVLVSPDVATCPDCYRDFTNPANRRYG